MDIKDYIEKHFGLTVIKIIPTAKGSGRTFNVTTNNGNYIAKSSVRSDYLTIHQKAQPILEKAGFKQDRVIFHDELLTLYEWLDGDGSGALTPERMRNAILYTKRYFDALKTLPVDEIEIKRMNAWDDAKSLGFLLDEFPNCAEYATAPCIHAAIKRLSAHRELLDKLPKQLIHGDLGADNFLFIDDEVNAIIDFTPETAPDLYGICQFLYWNVLWQEGNSSSLHQWARVYSDRIEFELFDILMIQAALFRVVGPLLNGYVNLDKRMMLLECLLKR